ncbi:MAG: TIGR04255 family protein [Planctomycetes bacterium]|nr:TIGR04255 family protein [Planctomycetota bacterium]
MSLARQFAIDLNESFPHLARAPIVEAVIHWRARGEKALEPGKLLQELKERLPDYPTALPQQEVQLEAQIGPAGAAQAQRARWHGFRLESTDRRYIAQFTRNGFVFSRVTPYEDWDRFLGEAKRLWQIHVELTEPSEIERLGVRFINRVVPVELHKLAEILTLPPQSPGSLTLPIGEFLHRSVYTVPGHPYSVNVIQTSQPPAPPETDAVGLILDIDVFTTATIEPNAAALDARLAEMRWLKNKTFYSLLTPQTIERFKESKE